MTAKAKQRGIFEKEPGSEIWWIRLSRPRVSLERGKTITFLTRSEEPVRDFRGAWWALCKKCDLGKFVKAEDDKLRWEGLPFHDLRR